MIKDGGACYLRSFALALNLNSCTVPIMEQQIEGRWSVIYVPTLPFRSPVNGHIEQLAEVAFLRNHSAALVDQIQRLAAITGHSLLQEHYLCGCGSISPGHPSQYRQVRRSG